MKRVRDASELSGTDWAFPWTAENADARWVPASDPVTEARRSPAAGPETAAEPDPAVCLVAGACAEASSGTAQGSGAGLAAGRGAAATAAGSPGAGRFPAEPRHLRTHLECPVDSRSWGFVTCVGMRARPAVPRAGGGGHGANGGARDEETRGGTSLRGRTRAQKVREARGEGAVDVPAVSADFGSEY